MDTLEKPPGKVQAIGILHLVGGIMNIILGLVWGFYGLVTGVMTFGIGLIVCCPAFISIPVGALEIYSGIKHLSSNHAGLKAPKLVGILELSSILSCSMISFIAGILTLVFLNDPEVAAYYERKQLSSY